MAGNSSSLMPLMWVWNRPALTCSVSPRCDLELDLVAWRQRVDEVGQELGRDRGRAVLVDLAGDPVGDPDLEVRGRQLEAGILGLEQDVGQDRQRAPARDGPADDGQAARQVLLHDREFHVGTLRLSRCWPGPLETTGATTCAPPVRGLVGIFPLSSYSVITVVTLWTRWTVVLGRAADAVDGRVRGVDERSWAGDVVVDGLGMTGGRSRGDRPFRRRLVHAPEPLTRPALRRVRAYSA